MNEQNNQEMISFMPDFTYIDREHPEASWGKDKLFSLEEYRNNREVRSFDTHGKESTAYRMYLYSTVHRDAGVVAMFPNGIPIAIGYDPEMIRSFRKEDGILQDLVKTNPNYQNVDLKSVPGIIVIEYFSYIPNRGSVSEDIKQEMKEYFSDPYNKINEHFNYNKPKDEACCTKGHFIREKTGSRTELECKPIRLVHFIPIHEIEKYGYAFYPELNIVLTTNRIANMEHPFRRGKKVEKPKKDNSVVLKYDIVENSPTKKTFWLKPIGYDVSRDFDSIRDTNRRNGLYVTGFFNGKKLIDKGPLDESEYLKYGVAKSRDDIQLTFKSKEELEYDKMVAELTKNSNELRKLQLEKELLESKFELEKLSHLHKIKMMELEQEAFISKKDIDIKIKAIEALFYEYKSKNDLKMAKAKNAMDLSYSHIKHRQDVNLARAKSDFELASLEAKLNREKSANNTQFTKNAMELGTKIIPAFL